MKPMYVPVPSAPAISFIEDLRAFWSLGARRLAPAAAAAHDAWIRLAESQREVLRCAMEIEACSLALCESTEAVAEASLELRFRAHCLGELEFLDEIDAPTLAQAARRILRTPPPERLAGTHSRFCDREQIWLQDREALDRAVEAHRLAYARHARVRIQFNRAAKRLRLGLEDVRRSGAPCPTSAPGRTRRSA